MTTIVLAVHAVGWPYYASAIGERVRHPLHAWLKPSGYLGQTAGFLALAMFLFMWAYPLRKRVRWLCGMGRLPAWLDVHIFVGLTVPVVGAVHAGWRFQGLIGLGYLAMLAVCLSGIVGRYLYTWIPRGKSGLELTAEQLTEQQDRLLAEVAALGPVIEASTMPLASVGNRTGGLGSILVGLVSADFVRMRAMRKVRRSCRDADRDTAARVGRLVRRQIVLSQQIRMLDATHRIFRFWHVAHMPFAITALLAVTIHVGVAIALGVTWVW